MPDFKAKMHQIRFRLGLRPRPRWGSYSAPPDPLAGLRGPTSKGRGGEGWGEIRWGGEGKGVEGRGGEQGRREGEGRPPNVRDALTPLLKATSIISTPYILMWIKSDCSVRRMEE